jgi:thiol-disulfide isomerase/thioredoxin
MKRAFIILFVLGFVMFSVGCQKQVSSSNPSVSPSTASAQAIMVPEVWYFNEFERLGFSVFRNNPDFPKLEFYDFAGKKYTIADFAGKVILFNIWATWCPPCRMEIPSIQKLHDTINSDKFMILAVSTGEKAQTVSDFIKENKHTFPVYLDPSSAIGSQLASRGIPTTYIISKTGKIIAATIGARSYDGAEFIKLINKLANE